MTHGALQPVGVVALQGLQLPLEARLVLLLLMVLVVVVKKR